MHTSHQFLLSHGTDRKEHLDMVEKLKRFFYEISDGLLYLLTVKLAPPNYYLKFRYLPQNFQKKSNLNAKPIALPNHLSYVRILLVGVCWLNLFLLGSNIHWVSPSHVFLVCWVIWTQVATLPTISLRTNFFIHLIFFFTLFQPRMWIWARRDREEWKDFQW